MLNITYASADEGLARQLQASLSAERIRLLNPMLLVLVTGHTQSDDSVRRTVVEARHKQQRILAVLYGGAALPDFMQGEAAFIWNEASRPAALVKAMQRLDMGEERIRRGRWYLAAIGLTVLIVFGASLWGIISGNVALPVSEYATENAAREAMIDGFVRPTLEGVMPRNTEDALNFPATVEAAPTRNRGFMIGTATALPLNQAATQAAIATSADLTMTAEASTPTPTP